MRSLTLLLLLVSCTSMSASMKNLKWSVVYNKKFAYSKQSGSYIYNQRKFSCDAPHDNKREGTVTALVGNYVSYFITDAEYCGAHPSIDRTFQTVNLLNNKSVSLKEIFPESDILNAIISDPFISNSIQGKQNSIKSLKQLQAVFNINEENCNAIYDDTFYAYTFYDYNIKSNIVSIRLSLTYQTYTCNPGLTQLGLQLKAPASLKPMLLDALNRKNLGRYHRNDTGLDVSF